ncbi:hypothetical protein [Paenibacillus sp. 32352]|uniref:hypothetical protein n=1 Tax=Paenibacillus sp. 32352 TaxID=1969111 RepID=UPI0009AC3BB0|nr:hypothetical protein [Paenibacillus sp. 32352]
MNKRGVFDKLFNRITKEDSIEYITKYSPTNEDLREKKKKELRQIFIDLAEIIPDDNFESFVELAVTKKMIGLPAYTYKLSNMDYFNKKTIEQLDGGFRKQDHPMSNAYTISVNPYVPSLQLIELSFQIKEYSEHWRTGEQNIESITGVYYSNVTLDLVNNIITIHTGNDAIHETIVNFLGLVYGLPIVPYTLKRITTTWDANENASFKTALLLDFINNRLKSREISSNYKEIKFKVSSSDIKDVTINGKNILTSYLACEYITLGKDIDQFKVSMTFDDKNFTVSFMLKGRDLDILKIVILDTNDDIFKQDVMKLIQSEYIKMCSDGIANETEIKNLLQTIYKKFAQKDSQYTDTIEETTIKNLLIFSKILDRLNKDQVTIELVNDFLVNNKAALDSTGYKSSVEVLKPIGNWLS